MKQSRFFKYIGMSAVGASIMSGAVNAAPEAAVMAKQQSPHFNAVASQLEMGGLSFSYSDQVAKNGLYNGLIQMAVSYLDAHTEYRGADAQKLSEFLTLDAVKASGSSASQRDGFVHYRAFNYMPEEKSIYALAYTDSKPSVGLQLAPAGADLVLEMHMNGAYDPNAEDKMYAALGPVGDLLKAAQAEQMANPMMKQWTEISKKINSRITIIADLNPKGFKAAPGFPMSGELLISVTDAELIWEMLKPLLEKQGVTAVVNGVNQDVVSPEAVGVWHPMLRYNSTLKQLYISTSAEYLALCEKSAKGEAPSLAKDREFLKVKEDLPASFSSMVYVSPSFSETVLNLVEMFGIPQIEEEEYLMPAAKMLVQKLKASDATKTATIYVNAPQQNGTLHVTNSPINLPEMGGNATALALLGAGTSTLFVGASYYKDSANKAACVINLSSMHKATRAVENIEGHKAGDPLKWELIVGATQPIQTKPACPEGGIYTLSPTFPESGKAAVECSCDGHAPDSTVNW